MKVIVAQIGSRHHYAIPRMLARNGNLEALYTDSCANRGIGRLIDTLIPRPMRRGTIAKLALRQIRGVPDDQIFSTDRLLWHRSANYERLGTIFADEMARWGTRSATHVYSMFGEGLPFLRVAKDHGLKICVEVFITPIAHRIIAEEQTKFPEWEKNTAIDENLEQRIHQVFDLADVLICPAEKVIEGIGILDRKALPKTKLVPYGSGASLEDRQNKPAPGRVLFAGTAELRKGIHYFAAAAQRLEGRGYQFRVAGDATENIRRQPACKQLNFLGRIPPNNMIDEFLSADVLVLPTLAEGSASVINEALVAGLPVITTSSAGTVGISGHSIVLVPERSSVDLADAIERVVRDRGLRERLASGAKEVSATLSEDLWGKRLIAALEF